MAFIVVVTFGIIFWVSNSVTQKNIQDDLVEIVESNVDEIEFYQEKNERKELHGDQYIEYLDGYLEIDDDFLDQVNGIYSSLYEETGKLLYGESPSARSDVEIPFSDGIVRKITWDRNAYYVYDRLLSGYGIDGLWLRGMVSQNQGTRQLQWLVRLSMIALPGLFVVAVIGGYWIAGRTLRPVHQITRAAAQISQGQDLDKRIHLGSGTDELHQLADVLDNMIGRLDKAFKTEQQFTSDASHELRTPMSVIMAQCEYTLENTRTPKEYEDALKVIWRQGRKMSKLIEDMLCFARLEQNKDSYPKEAVHFSTLVEDICVDMALLQSRNIVLDWEIEPNIILVGNAMLLTRMITNLISNGYRYGKQNGRISVRLKRESGILLAVEDNGIGISDEQQEKIFERFYRVDTARFSEGTGLGLAMVKDIAKYHGGTVEVISVLGEGSRFTIKFPI
ncbi:HAMP domain-containing protein [bacterium 1xD42-62]|uniref:histidine kinase n=2 Tax=Parablautia muri TaxID=2320879 RepID=A0A9X5GQV7_9FIRM|nr:ATP-binding protein [Parablautia muri]NBJ91674.1 HAMP domain-containing protein [Parablautia muri]